MARKMKDSGIEWIGEIPETWTWIPLKRVFESRDGGAWGTEPQDNELDRVCIRVADFNFDQLIVKESEDYTVRNYDSTTINKLLLQKGDILVEKSGGGDLTPVGRVIGFDLPINALYANFIERLRTNSLVRPKYLLYLLALYYYVGVSKKYIKQTTGIQNLDLSSFLTEYISIPSLSEQQAIADYLDHKCSLIDSIIEKQKAVIEKLKLYKQSIITEAVTKGLDPSVKMKPSDIEWIGDIAEGWEVTPLTKQLDSIIDYRGKTPKKVDEGVFLVTAKNIKDGKINYEASKEFVLLEEYEEIMHRGRPEIGDVLLTTEAPLGEVANVDRTDIALAQRIIKFRACNGKLDNYYLKYWLMSRGLNSFLLSLSTGSTATGIKASRLFMLPIVLPSTPEQKAIVEYLDDKCLEIDNVINIKLSLVDKLTNYKKSLIYECVTGKREVG